MPTLMQRGLTWLQKSLPDAAAETVSISTGRTGNDVSIESVQAVPGRRDYNQYAASEWVGTEEVFDWIVCEQDLLFNDVKREPQEGWEIRWMMPDQRTAVYRAMPTGNSRAFDVLDQLGRFYRIHTKLIEVIE